MNAATGCSSKSNIEKGLDTPIFRGGTQFEFLDAPYTGVPPQDSILIAFWADLFGFFIILHGPFIMFVSNIFNPWRRPFQGSLAQPFFDDAVVILIFVLTGKLVTQFLGFRYRESLFRSKLVRYGQDKDQYGHLVIWFDLQNIPAYTFGLFGFIEKPVVFCPG